MGEAARSTVVIVGGGYSGGSLAVALADRGADVTLVERDPALMGRGVAYGTAAAHHLLNVRASGMSAVADRPADFADWLAARGQGDGHRFAPRALYGDYLAGRLAAAAVTRVAGEAVDLAEDGPGVIVRLADGRALRAARAVLATGNLPPLPPPGVTVPLLDPWRDDPAAGLGEDATILLVGTGLTAVDVALSLDAAHFRGRILMLSRRGLVPHAHAEPAPRPDPPAASATGAALLARTRARARELGWREAVDSLRPVTQAMWDAAGTGERARFLRHLRPWWDIHRHRIAPEIARRLAALTAAGRLRIAAGRILSTTPEGDRVVLRWRPRGSGTATATPVDRIVNCTGPQTDVARSADPLLRALVAAGTIRPGPLRLGMEVAADCALVDASGRPSTRLFAIGPVTRERYWEVVAVPDIRVQVERLAARLAQ